MEETEVFAHEAADVAMAAVNEGLARIDRSWEEVYSRTRADIAAVRSLVDDMEKAGHILRPPPEMLEAALNETLAEL
jgi:malate dehydrogenase (oxaloacetate-decarboxylating)